MIDRLAHLRDVARGFWREWLDADGTSGTADRNPRRADQRCRGITRERGVRDGIDAQSSIGFGADKVTAHASMTGARTRAIRMERHRQVIFGIGARSLVEVWRVCRRGAQAAVGTSTRRQREEAVVGWVVGRMVSRTEWIGGKRGWCADFATACRTFERGDGVLGRGRAGVR